MKTQNDNYIETYTGKKFFILNPQPEDIDIADIAHALSLNCRYTGHCKNFYSVAEHSLYVSQLVSDENRLWGLLHDASEAYLTDVASPIKPFLTNYKELEKNVMNAICKKYDLPVEMPEEVHKADMDILRKEAFELMKSKGDGWVVNIDNPEPLIDTDINCHYPNNAEALFLEQFEKLTKQRT